MPLFVGHLLMWPLKSGHLHIVLFTNFLLFSCIPFFITILNSCIILLMYMLNNTGERPHPCLTPLFMCIDSDIPSYCNLCIFIVVYVFLLYFYVSSWCQPALFGYPD